MSPKALSQLKAVAQVFMTIIVLFTTPIRWALALLFVLFSLGSCANSLCLLPAALCFAAGVGLHLLILFVPLESDEISLPKHD